VCRAQVAAVAVSSADIRMALRQCGSSVERLLRIGNPGRSSGWSRRRSESESEEPSAAMLKIFAAACD
jgi:hypothetical protein